VVVERHRDELRRPLSPWSLEADRRCQRKIGRIHHQNSRAPVDARAAMLVAIAPSASWMMTMLVAPSRIGRSAPPGHRQVVAADVQT